MSALTEMVDFVSRRPLGELRGGVVRMPADLVERGLPEYHDWLRQNDRVMLTKEDLPGSFLFRGVWVVPEPAA